jgi:hypothetical protein
MPSPNLTVAGPGPDPVHGDLRALVSPAKGWAEHLAKLAAKRG